MQLLISIMSLLCVSLSSYASSTPDVVEFLYDEGLSGLSAEEVLGEITGDASKFSEDETALIDSNGLSFHRYYNGNHSNRRHCSSRCFYDAGRKISGCIYRCY